MRFVILTFSFANDWVRQQSTPSLAAGEVETDVGRFYRVWSPSVGIFSVEYQPRPALEGEMDEFAIDSGAFETLLPGKSAAGSVSFEIPEDEDPVIARVTGVPIPIDLAGCGT